MKPYWFCLSRLLIQALVCFSAVFNVAAETAPRLPEREEQALSKQESLARDTATVTYGTASAPVGYFLLIRRDRDVCAIKFTSFHRGDFKKRTWWNAGGYSYFAEYDWYYQKDSSGDFTIPNVKTGHGKLDQHSLTGPTFHLSGQSGTTFIKCGSMKGLLWTYPNNIAFNPTFSHKADKGYEMAPTRWRESAKIDLHNARLNWYQFDGTYKRENTLIALPELCCE